jgi:hypothetical protein
MSHCHCIVKGLYKHTTSGKLYNVIGVGRNVRNPHKQIVIYEQLYDSTLANTKTKLPYGSLWTRDLDDFTAKVSTYERKFEKVNE